MCNKEKCSHAQESTDSAQVPALPENVQLDENLVDKHFTADDMRNIVTEAIFTEIIFNRPELMAEFLSAATGESVDDDTAQAFVARLRFTKAMERITKVPGFAGFMAI